MTKGDGRAWMIRGGGLVTMDPSLGTLEGDLLVEDGLIAAVGPPGSIDPLQIGGAEIVEGRGLIALPGFVDTHRHMWESALRHVGWGWDLIGYIAKMQRVVAAAMTPDDVFIGNRLGALTALDAGITTIADECHLQNSREHTEQAIAGLRSTGIRARFGYGWASGGSARTLPTDPHPAGMESVRGELLADDSEDVTMYAMLRGPILSSEAITVEDLARARDLGLRASFHVGADLVPDLRDVELLAAAGLLNDDLTLIHCGTSSEDELRKIAAAGAGVSVAPGTEALMPGVGLPAVARLLRAGVEPGLSVDIEVAVAGDLFNAMRTALTVNQVMHATTPDQGDEYEPLAPRLLLELATIRGAEALGLGAEIGSLTPGKRADLILLDGEAINLAPFASPAEAVVLAGHAGNVKAVFVSGRPLKFEGELVGLDLQAELEAATESHGRLMPLLRASDIPDRGGALELLS